MFSTLLYAVAAVLLILAVVAFIGVLHVGASAIALLVGAIIAAVVAWFLSGGGRGGPGRYAV